MLPVVAHHSQLTKIDNLGAMMATLDEILKLDSLSQVSDSKTPVAGHTRFGRKELLTPPSLHLGQRANDYPILNPSGDAHEPAVPVFIIPSSFRKALIVAE